MQTTILASTQLTSTQRSKRPKKGKQPIEDDQLGPESMFRASWVHAMPENCNRVIRELFQHYFVKNCRYISILKILCMTYPFVFLNADFCASMPQWPFCNDGCRLPR
jgi:hypothetical protein